MRLNFNAARNTLRRGILLSLSHCLIVCLSLSALAQQPAPPTTPKPSVWDASHWYFVLKDEPAHSASPGVTHHVLRSAKMERDMGFNVLVPPDYETSGKRYPVVFMLHGASGHEGCRGFAPKVRALMEAGKIAPAIWVWPNGGQGSMWRDGPEGNPHRIYVAHYFIHELLPHVDATWRTLVTREGRAVMGFSMGGYGCVRFAFERPDLFAACLPIAGGAFVPKTEDEVAKQPVENFPSLLLRKNLTAIKSGLALRIVAGTKDFNYEPTLKLADALDEAGVAYESDYPDGLTHGDLGRYFSEANIAWIHRHLAPAR